MSEYIDIEAIAKWSINEAYAASASYNALFKIDIKSGNVEYICQFDEPINVNRLYTTAFKVGEKIYFVPAAAGGIAVYEPSSNKLYRIEVKTVDRNKYKSYKPNAKFNGGIVVGTYIYMTPCTYPGLICLNTITDDVEYYNDWVQDGDFVFRKHPILDNNKIFLPCTKNNRILCFDTKTHFGEMITLPTKYRGWWSMCKVDDGFFLSPKIPGPIIYWEIKNKHIVEFGNYPESFCGADFYFSLCFKRGAVVCFLPAHSNMGILLDIKKGSISEWKIDHVNIGSKVSFMFYLDEIIYLKIFNDNQIKYMCINCKTLESYDYSLHFISNKKRFWRDYYNSLASNVLKEKSEYGLGFLLDLIIADTMKD